jgi:tartrate dehydratase beta subunit/fumarate hydratase class I family protein
MMTQDEIARLKTGDQVIVGGEIHSVRQILIPDKAKVPYGVKIETESGYRCVSMGMCTAVPKPKYEPIQTEKKTGVAGWFKSLLK